jgi:hypothetical protein
MRVSVDDDDPGYRPDASTGRYAVYLNGERMAKVVTADEEEGMLVRLKMDRNGFPVVLPDRSAVERETLHGSVVIVAGVPRGTHSDG